MKKTSIIVFTFLIFVTCGFSKKMFELPEVMKPQRIRINDNQLYVSVRQNYGVQVYNLSDGSLKLKLGKRGEGPGEIKRYPFIFPQEDSIVLSSRGKVMKINPDGKLIWEKRIHPRFMAVKPVGENYVGSKFNFDQTDGSHRMDFYLLDGELNEVKMIYSAKMDAASAAAGGKFQNFKMLVHHLAAYVYHNRIYIADSRKGLYLKVYDSIGNPIHTIHPRVKKEKVTQSFKDRLIAEYKQHEKELWPLMKDSMSFYTHFPAIRTCQINNEKIYLTTYLQKGDRHLILVLDLKGHFLNRLMIPLKSWKKVVYSSRQEDLFSFQNDMVYELFENPESETYELHLLKIGIDKM